MKRLGYYTSQFPFPQGRSAGPYATFLQPPNASLMRVRVACVAVGQQIGQPVKPNLKMQRACGCKRRSHCRCHHRHGLGDSGMPTYDATPLTPAQVEQTILTPPVSVDTTGTYNYGDLTAPAAPTDSYGNPVDLTGGSSGQAQSPPGTQLLYTVSWTNSLLHPFTGASDVQSAFAQKLSSGGSGMSVASSQVTSPPLVGGVTGLSANFLINDQIGHDTLANAQSVLDSLMRSIVGNNVTASGLTVASGSGLPFNLGSFLTQNWALVAAGVVGFIVVDKLL